MKIPVLSDSNNITSIFYKNKEIILPYTSLYFIKYHHYKYQRKRNNYNCDLEYLKEINHVSEYNNSITLYDTQNNAIMLSSDKYM